MSFNSHTINRTSDNAIISGRDENKLTSHGKFIEPQLKNGKDITPISFKKNVDDDENN